MAGIKVHFDGKIGKQPELQGEGDKAWVQVGVATERWVGEGKGDVRNYNGQQIRPRLTRPLGSTWWHSAVRLSILPNGSAPATRSSSTMARWKFTTYSKKDKQSGNVIDNKAVGLRAIARDISGPFRVVPKSENNGNGNGNGGNGNHQQARCARTATGPASGGSSSSGRGASHTERQLPQPGRHSSGKPHPRRFSPRSRP